MDYFKPIIFLVLIITASACAQSTPLPIDYQTVNICEAALEPIGTRVRVVGIYDGFGYETKSQRVFINSSILCDDVGAGIAIASLINRSEADKISSLRPGERLIIEGTIEKIDEARFIEIIDAIIIEWGE